MKNFLPLLTFLLFGFNGFSQIVFEDAYYIDDSGRRIEGQIENVGWQNNPQQFLFRHSEASEPVALTTEAVREFGIGNGVKYVKVNIEMDRSSDNLSLMSDQRAPEFKEEELFLKVLVEGKASLYSYVDGNLRRYFFGKLPSEINQLVYKKYKTPDGEVAYNKNFRQQLLNEVRCGESRTKLRNLDYTQSDLVKYFVNYNSCENVEPVNYAASESGMKFHLSVKPGLDFSSLSIANNMVSDSRTDFNSELGFRIGLEAEFVLGFNKNKWALIVEPSYRSYTSEKEGLEVDYSSLEIPFGLRHYLFFNDSSKMFVNAAYVFDFTLGESVISREPRENLDIEPRGNLSLGLGYSFANTYSVELRYFVNREILNYLNWRSQYKVISVVFGWKIF